MERKQRVAKLEALLARVQSRSHRGETHGNAAVAMPQVAAAAPPVARVAPAPVQPIQPVQPVAATPKPSPVAASAPPPAEAARPAAHEMQEEVATVVRDVPVEALAAIAAATAQQQAKPTPAAGTPATSVSAAPPPAAGQPAQASVAPAFRGTSAFGGLSKKMTLIGTAPPANWPPRGAESAPPPEPAKADVEEQPQTPEQEQDEAPQIQASESEGDLDALLGDESTSPPAAVEREPEPAPIAAAAAPMIATTSAITEPKKSDLPIVTPEAPLAKKKSRTGSTAIVMIVLWLIAMAVIWFVYRKSM